MAKPQQGRDLIIYRSSGTTALVGAVKSCTVKQRAELNETVPTTTTNGAATYRHYKTTYLSWSISFNYIVYDNDVEPLRIGEKISLRVGIRQPDGGGILMKYSGDAIVEEADVTGTVRSLTAGSYLLRGTGPLVDLVQ